MIYVSASIWLLIAVLMAWGVYHLWTTMVKPRTLDVLLFPGTLVAEVGRTVGLLVAGAKFAPKALAPPDKKDPKPYEGPLYEPSVPVFGPMVVGIVPFIFILCAIYAVLTRLGSPVIAAVPSDQISAEVPGTLSVVWSQLRGLITLAERTFDALRNAEMVHWRTAVLTYVLACLCIRLSPFKGNAAGLLGSIGLIAATVTLVGTLTTAPADLIAGSWPLFCVIIGMLVLLMIITLMVRGVVLTVRVLAHWH